MDYQHKSVAGGNIPLPAGKAVCVGRNYADHIQELNNPVPDEPLLFIKPNTALVDMDAPLSIPKGNCHNELEVVLLISSPLKSAKPLSEEEVLTAIWGVGLALDLTLRDKQTELKQKGHPWERAKAFDASCPVSEFVQMDQIPDLQDLSFELSVNDEIRQSGHTRFMLTDCIKLIQEITQCFSLMPGDIVLTGTPKGVGSLHSGDKLAARLFPAQSINPLIEVQTTVV